MEWGTLVATLGGGLIAIAGTVLADRLRTRQEHRRTLQARRRDVYTEFIAAAGAAHTELRRLAQNGGGATGLEEASRLALTDARIYEVRERLFLDASTRIAGAGQTMFERLRALRRAVAAGAGISSPAFHDLYHPYLDAVWAYREAVRTELEGRSLAPADFGWSVWDGRERCAHCRQRAADTAPARNHRRGGEDGADRDAGDTPLMTSNPRGDAPHPGRSQDGAVALTAHVKAGPGGVMTDEVGVITGDVTLTSEPGPDGTVQVRIQYTGAGEWYTLTGSPAPNPPDGLAAFHERVVDAVKAGGAAEVPDSAA